MERRRREGSATPWRHLPETCGRDGGFLARGDRRPAASRKVVLQTRWQAGRRVQGKVRKRFVQWAVDACFRPHDQAWLDYQEEIGLRHTPKKKNLTDGARTPSVVPLRYLISFAAVVSMAARNFFIEVGVSGDELQRLEDTWSKTVLLHIALWSRPYVKEGLW